MKKRLLIVGFVIFVSLMLLSSMSFANSEYTDWTETSKLPSKSGAYKLTNDVTITSSSSATVGAWSGSGTTVTVDLNGHTVKFSGSSAYYYVQNSGTLIIEDSVGTGVMTNAGATSNSYVIYVKGNCQINGGTIENTLSSGKALYVQNGDKKQAACTLNGGTILNSYDRGGRAVCVGSSATFTMNSGEIKSIAGNAQGDIPAVEGGTFKMTGGTIKVEATRTIETADGIVDAAGMAIQSNSETVEITGGTIQADGYALKTRYVVVNPEEGKMVNISAGKAILNPMSAPSSGKGNQLLGGNFDAPVLSKGIYPTNVELYGGTYTNNNVAMDVKSYLSGATVDDNGTVTCNHAETYEEGAVGATCTTEGKTADIICSNCKKTVTQGSEIEKLEHTYGEWVIDKEATCKEKGSKYKECSCGDKKTEELPVITHNYENGKCKVCGDIEKLPEPEIGDVDFIVPEDNVEGNNTSIGVEESETVKETLDTSLKADNKLNEKVEEARKNGETVKVEIKMEALEKDSVKDDEKQKILQTVKANQTVHQYFDISVLVTANQKELGKLTQLTKKMKFSMEISKDLIQEGRKFYIIKLHGDEVNRIEAVLNGTKLEFETDQFSTFALAYEDNEEEAKTEVPEKEETKTEISEVGEKDETPKTGVINIPGYVWLSLAGIALVGILTTKKSSKHTK